MPASSSAWWPVGGSCSTSGSRNGRPTASVRRSSSGRVRRSSSSTGGSPASWSGSGSRSCGRTPRSCGSTPRCGRDGTARPWPRPGAGGSRRRCASAGGSCSRWRSTAPGGRPTLAHLAAGCGACSSPSSASTPGPERRGAGDGDPAAGAAALVRRLPARAEAACPYPGLGPYDVADADGFFGREADIADCRDRLAATGVVAVVGPSGSGQVVAAQYARGSRRDPARTGGRVVVITPGRHPSRPWPRSASRGRPSVLVVDQAEEVVTPARTATSSAGSSPPWPSGRSRGSGAGRARGPLRRALGATASWPDWSSGGSTCCPR